MKERVAIAVLIVVAVVWAVALFGRVAYCEIPYGINGPKENCQYVRVFP